MTASVPFLPNTILSFPAINPENPDHAGLLLPMFPEYICSKPSIDHSNDFNVPHGKASFIVHRKQGESSGYLYRPTVKLALEELQIQVVMHGDVLMEINQAMDTSKKLTMLHEILQSYSLTLDLARIAARTHNAQVVGHEEFFNLGDGYSMRSNPVNSDYFQVVRKSEFEPWSAFNIDRSIAPSFSEVHFDRLRHRLQMFQHLLNGSRFQYDSRSDLTTRIIDKP